MNDLKDEELASEWCIQEPRHESWHERRMIIEIRRRRAEQAAGREHVERVVREEVLAGFARHDRAHHIGFPDEVARHVADRLSMPVLSEEGVVNLTRLRGWFEIGCEPDDLKPALAWIDRLIAARKP